MLGYIYERCSKVGITLEKILAVVAKDNEASQLNEVSWAWKIQYGLDFLLFHLESFVEDNMEKIEHLNHSKLTIGQLSIKIRICKYS